MELGLSFVIRELRLDDLVLYFIDNDDLFYSFAHFFDFN